MGRNKWAQFAPPNSASVWEPGTYQQNELLDNILGMPGKDTSASTINYRIIQPEFSLLYPRTIIYELPAGTGLMKKSDISTRSLTTLRYTNIIVAPHASTSMYPRPLYFQGLLQSVRILVSTNGLLIMDEWYQPGVTLLDMPIIPANPGPQPTEYTIYLGVYL